MRPILSLSAVTQARWARRASAGLAVVNSSERKAYRLLLSPLTYIHVGNTAQGACVAALRESLCWRDSALRLLTREPPLPANAP